jgi:hypothetical protein
VRGVRFKEPRNQASVYSGAWTQRTKTSNAVQATIHAHIELAAAASHDELWWQECQVAVDDRSHDEPLQAGFTVSVVTFQIGNIGPSKLISAANALVCLLGKLIERNSLALIRDRWAGFGLRRVVNIIVACQECHETAYNLILDEVMANFLGIRWRCFKVGILGTHPNSHNAILLRSLILLSSFSYGLGIRVDSIGDAVSQLDVSQEGQVSLDIVQVNGVCNLQIRNIVDGVLCLIRLLSIMNLFQLQGQSNYLVIQTPGWPARTATVAMFDKYDQMSEYKETAERK